MSPPDGRAHRPAAGIGAGAGSAFRPMGTASAPGYAGSRWRTTEPDAAAPPRARLAALVAMAVLGIFDLRGRRIGRSSGPLALAAGADGGRRRRAVWLPAHQQGSVASAEGRAASLAPRSSAAGTVVVAAADSDRRQLGAGRVARRCSACCSWWPAGRDPAGRSAAVVADRRGGRPAAAARRRRRDLRHLRPDPGAGRRRRHRPAASTCAPSTPAGSGRSTRSGPSSAPSSPATCTTSSPTTSPASWCRRRAPSSSPSRTRSGCCWRWSRSSRPAPRRWRRCGGWSACCATRDAQPDAPLAPLAGVAELAPLLEQLQRAPADRWPGCTWTATLDGLPVEVSTSAYRVVMEALTNVRQHAAGRPGRRRVGAAYPGLAAGPGRQRRRAAAQPRPRERPGYGLVGLTERVRAVGGRITAGPGIDGGWVVDARVARSTVEVAR